MADLISTGGAGAGGTLIGAVLAFFGFKGKIKDIDKRIDRLTDDVLFKDFKDTCDAKHDGVDKQFENQAKLIENVHKDVRTILEKI